MAKTRRSPSTWVLLFTIAAALALHAGAALTYALLRPVPPPRLFLHFHGPGSGTVQSRPAGLSCTQGCAVAFAPGTEIELVVTPGEDSTFAGWSETCQPRADHVLACALSLEQDTHVHVELGLVPREVEVAWVKVDDQEAEEQELTVALPDPEIEAEMLVEPLAELLAEPEPEPEPVPVPPPPPPPAAEAPPPPPPEMANLRSVEVADENEVEQAPDDATHLSDKNRNVAEETRALDTNLERAQAGEQTASAQSDVQSEEVGAEEEVIAELEDSEPTTLDDPRTEESAHSGDSEQAVGVRAGEDGDGGEDGERGDDSEREEPGVLAMRDIEGRGALLDEKTKPGQGGQSGAPGRAGRPGVKTQLAFEDYERIVGKDKVAEEVALGQRQTSTRRGRWERKLGAVKSALENFTPEVKTGNQTALKTRAAPFAVYIARMHRRIHDLWSFGFLDDLNGKPSTHPLNDWNLYTQIEIVINPDGTVHKTNIVINSGRLEFDVAAIDTILTASPYEQPPAQIRSPDGRVYIHWGFYRNHRQCGTFNAQPFILAEAPRGSDATSDAASTPLDDGALVRRARTNAPAAPETRGASETADAPAADAAGPGGNGGLLSPTDPRAVHTANLWLTGYAQQDISRMLSVSRTPFRSGIAFEAGSKSELGTVYRTVLQETGARIRDWKLLSPAGYRQRFGTLPPGVDAARPQLLLVVQAGRERFTLALEPQPAGAYEVTGLYR